MLQWSSHVCLCVVVVPVGFLFLFGLCGCGLWLIGGWKDLLKEQGGNEAIHDPVVGSNVGDGSKGRVLVSQGTGLHNGGALVVVFLVMVGIEEEGSPVEVDGNGDHVSYGQTECHQGLDVVNGENVPPIDIDGLEGKGDGTLTFGRRFCKRGLCLCLCWCLCW